MIFYARTNLAMPITDTMAPSLTLLGSNPITLLIGDVYVDAGASATDVVDDDATSVS